ncbi:MAG: hypothetical protein K6B41_05295 [Butyrivibrio sp.]|nr:hypothetical protein [Butyrivibrio sp.]
MKEFIVDQLSNFAFMTGIIGNMREIDLVFPYIVIAVAGLLCLLGIISFRLVSSAVVFMYLSEVIINIFSDNEWGKVVVFFVVIGIFAAMITYSRPYLSATIVCCGLIGAEVFLYTYTHFNNVILAIILTILISVIIILLIATFPVETICIITAVEGALLLKNYIPEHWMILLFGGLILQLIISYKQTIFSKRYPDKVQELIDRKRRKI